MWSEFFPTSARTIGRITDHKKLASANCQKWLRWSGEKQPIAINFEKRPNRGVEAEADTNMGPPGETETAVSSFIMQVYCGRRGSSESNIFKRFASVLEEESERWKYMRLCMIKQSGPASPVHGNRKHQTRL